MVNCFELEKSSPEDAASLPLRYNLEASKAPETTSFKYNTMTRSRFGRTDQYYPECPEQNDWNTDHIRKSILEWKASMNDRGDFHWFHDSSSEPLDPSNPVIEITFDQLVGRTGFEMRKVTYPMANLYPYYHNPSST